MTETEPANMFEAPADTLDEDSLRDGFRRLQHAQLALRDRVFGLEQENARLRELIPMVNSVSASERLEAGWLLAEKREAEMNAMRHEMGQALKAQEQSFRNSARWKLGSALLRPVNALRGKR
ncbi:hypothetical protein [Mycetocola spongiae]|uniref:hypothetical protein n=1 Tax=Mycetocola spongiae TaxID=2859226 RepID=UPI001CF35351|nr:hypothetical protein [Mycetocola spongiae]UCR90340.1 hypothetical protein KXZ72_06745 [Mycetocola spongiae]